MTAKSKTAYAGALPRAIVRPERPAAQRATRQEKVRREERIVGLLNRGASVPEIAANEGLTLKRMRNVVREILAQRMPQPPAEFLALQVSRLNEALLVSFSAMHSTAEGANFEAVDRVVKIVRELDRYHGFAAAPRWREETDAHRLPPPVEHPLALEGPGQNDSQITLQAPEKAQFGLANSPLPRAVERPASSPDAHWERGRGED